MVAGLRCDRRCYNEVELDWTCAFSVNYAWVSSCFVFGAMVWPRFDLRAPSPVRGAGDGSR